MKKRIIGALIALCTMLGVGALVAPPASASPLCSTGGICGHIVVSTTSRGGCLVRLDGNWANGSAGYHPAIANRSGYSRFSSRYFKDTDGFRISANCKGKTTRGTKIYYGGTWYKIKDYQLGTLKLWYK